jgi:predicted Zn-dependent protease
MSGGLRSALRRLLPVGVAAITVVALCLLWQPMVVTWHHRSARQLLLANRNQQAIEKLRKLTPVSFARAQTHLLLARAHRRLGNLDQAAALVRRAGTMGGDPECIRRETWLLDAQSGHLRDAEKHLPELLLDPRDDGPDICRAYVVGYFAEFRVGDAARLLDVWEKQYPEDAEAQFMKGQLLVALERADEAAEAYYRGLDLEPGRTAIRCRLAYILIERLKLDEAAEVLRPGLDADAQNPDVLLCWATCLFAQKETQQAGEALTRLLVAAPEHFEARRLYGQLELSRGRFSEALRYLEPAAGERPYDKKCRYLLGRTLQSLGRASDAKPHLDYVVEAKERQRQVEIKMREVADRPDDAQLRFEIGSALLKHGSPEEGARWLQTALHLQPNHAEARQALAACSEAQRNRQTTVRRQ